MLTKINLSEFKESELKVDQLLSVKGGDGETTTNKKQGSCTCKGSDSDSFGGEKDMPTASTSDPTIA